MKYLLTQFKYNEEKRVSETISTKEIEITEKITEENCLKLLDLDEENLIAVDHSNNSMKIPCFTIYHIATEEESTTTDYYKSFENEERMIDYSLELAK